MILVSRSFILLTRGRLPLLSRDSLEKFSSDRSEHVDLVLLLLVLEDDRNLASLNSSLSVES